MKAYIKRTILFILYHPVSYLAGGLIAGLFSIIIGAILEKYREMVTGVIQPLLITILPLAFLFFFLQRDSYENRRFAPLTIITSALPFFVIQRICIFSGNLGMMVVGGVGVVTPVLFPNAEHLEIMWPYMVVQLGLQLFVYLPTYLLASYCGYKCRQIEITTMVEEDE